ncbi:hypothetical protein [Singulisphaera sp. PoT]|uniref:hypothetical protein n=1 Tax=Singulisphaera sp. PoT TaxID=3411797 RepID=UPI003BF4760F
MPEDHEEHAKAGHSAAKIDRGTEVGERAGRTWSERVRFPIKFRHFSGLDAGGRGRVFIKFELAPGESRPDPEALAIVKLFKEIDGKPSGLRIDRDKGHGWVCSFPDTSAGRIGAEYAAARLITLALGMDEEERRSR